MFIIHTDGSHCTYSNLGTWAYYNVTINKLKTGWEKNTTSARMEITAIIKAVESVSRNNKVNKILIRTDVKLLEQHINDNFQTCVRNNWLTENKVKPFSNVDLLKRLFYLLNNSGVIAKAQWVKGHSEKSNQTEIQHDVVDRACYYLLQKLREKEGKPTKRGFQ